LETSLSGAGFSVEHIHERDSLGPASASDAILNRVAKKYTGKRG